MHLFDTAAQKLCGEEAAFTHVNIMIMPVCAEQLPEGLAVLHGLLKLSVGLKEVRRTQHAAISLRRRRNLSTLCSHSTLVTQAPSEIGAHSHRKTHRRKPPKNESEERLRMVNSHVVIYASFVALVFVFYCCFQPREPVKTVALTGTFVFAVHILINVALAR